jgi:hypothetical protein
VVVSADFQTAHSSGGLLTGNNIGITGKSTFTSEVPSDNPVYLSTSETSEINVTTNVEVKASNLEKVQVIKGGGVGLNNTKGQTKSTTISGGASLSAKFSGKGTEVTPSLDIAASTSSSQSNGQGASVSPTQTEYQGNVTLVVTSTITKVTTTTTSHLTPYGKFNTTSSKTTSYTVSSTITYKDLYLTAYKPGAH